MTFKTKKELELEKIAKRLLPDNDGFGPSCSVPQLDESDSEFNIPDLQETLLEDVMDEFATFSGCDPLTRVPMMTLMISLP